MDGWIIALVAGMVVIVLFVVLLGAVVKAATTTATTAQAVLTALEEIKATTAPLAGLRSFDPEAATVNGDGDRGDDAAAKPGLEAEEPSEERDSP